MMMTKVADEMRQVYEAVANSGGTSYAHEVSDRTGIAESVVIGHLIRLTRAGWIRLTDDSDERLTRYRATGRPGDALRLSVRGEPVGTLIIDEPLGLGG